MSDADPQISIVIPVYNEEGILREAVTELREKLATAGWTYELLLAENGSVDSTIAIGTTLSQEMPEVSIFSCAEPNYGAALREGIMRARGELVICDEIDLCDIDFYQRAIGLLERDNADMVVGSKVMKGAHDERPALRRVATRVMNGLLRVAVNFRGTDTHGLKAFRRETLLPVITRCVVDKDLFASEFVIRAGHEDYRIVEIPVRVAEKRRPAINLVRRVPRVMSDLARLTYAIRFRG